MFGWFKKGAPADLKVDIHSHLIPGIDDGVKDLSEAISIIRTFEKAGFTKLITTPHIHSEYYPNTKTRIIEGLNVVKSEIKKENLKIDLEAAAEYYIDGAFLDQLDNPADILSFGNRRYVLVETPFMNKPLIFDEVIFKMKSLGFSPVLAHPERYSYLTDDLSWLRKVKNQGVLLQLTASSLLGMYGKIPQKIAKKLLKEQMIDFVGSDVHRAKQIDKVLESFSQKFSGQNLRNNDLA